jgi:hypothetical protein
MATPELELDHDGHPDAGFILPKIGRLKTAVLAKKINHRSIGIKGLGGQ